MKLLISLVNHPDLKNPEHVTNPSSVRLSRAVKQARKLREGNGNVMLWQEGINGQWFRVSLQHGEKVVARVHSHGGRDVSVGWTPTDKVTTDLSIQVHLDSTRRSGNLQLMADVRAELRRIGAL